MMVNDKTGGKHADKIDQATGKARDALDSLDGKTHYIHPGWSCALTPPRVAPVTASSSSRPAALTCSATVRTGTEVLLQLRQGTPYMEGHWAAAAAGHVERGETAYDAAQREATRGARGSPTWALEFAFSMQRTQHAEAIDERVDWFFTARSWTRRSPDRGAAQGSARSAGARWTGLPEPMVPHEAHALAHPSRDGPT